MRAGLEPWWFVLMLARVSLCVTRCGAASDDEVLADPGFESASSGAWQCPWGTASCEYTAAAARSGATGMAVAGRTVGWHGPSQVITTSCGLPSYQGSVYAKVTSGQGGHHLKMMVDFTFEDNTHQYDVIADRKDVRVADGWVQLLGTFAIPTSKPVTRTRVYVSGPAGGADLAVDDASVLPQQCTCTTPLTHRDVIETVRKGGINVQLNVSGNVNRNDFKIRIRQVKSSFPFGTAVNARKYLEDAAGGRYRQAIHAHFNWAVLENALKWYSIERVQDKRNMTLAVETVKELRRNGLKVRGHTLLWSVEKQVQDWQKALSGQEMRDRVAAHIRDTMQQTQGLLEHWDVNNELVHGQWYADRLGDPGFNLETFRLARRQDPDVKFFLNDFNVVANGWSTDDYLKQAKEFRSAYVGLYGLGAQCHFGREQEPDPVVIKERLDKLSKAGLPIWVTELDVQSANATRRADFIEKALRAFFGHPNVEGILLWGFWDQAHWRGELAALATGPNVEPTEAGVRVHRLMREEWWTDVTVDLPAQADVISLRGFHGDYEATVLRNGQETQAQAFTLEKARPTTITVDIY